MATADDVLRVARSQLGQGEHPPGSNHNKYSQWYGIGDGPWCDTFISWCADQAGAGKAIGRFAYTPWHADWFRDHGRWGQRPRKGAIVFFDWGGSHSIDAIDHVGIVEAVRGDGSIVTVEGNTADAVHRRVRRSGIAGYGYPTYRSGGSPTPPGKPDTSAPKWPGRYFRYPAGRSLVSGNDVRQWQKRMRDRGWHLSTDGVYGPESARICGAFQAEKGLEIDGVVGPDTWRAAWTAPIT